MPHKVTCVSTVTVDINGDAEPNANASDRFYFQMMGDGSLRPWGGSWDSSNVWTSKCAKNATPTDKQRCAGHIMENGLKAEWK